MKIYALMSKKNAFTSAVWSYCIFLLEFHAQNRINYEEAIQRKRNIARSYAAHSSMDIGHDDDDEKHTRLTHSWQAPSRIRTVRRRSFMQVSCCFFHRIVVVCEKFKNSLLLNFSTSKLVLKICSSAAAVSAVRISFASGWNLDSSLLLKCQNE